MAFPTFTKTFHDAAYAALDLSRPELSVSSKSVFITGGSAGIGAAIAKSFAAAGSTKIAIMGRNAAKLTEVKQSLESEYAASNLQVIAVVGDVVDKAATSKAFADARAALGPIDILIANAGYLPSKGTIEEGNLDEWYRGFEINVKGSFIVLHEFLKVAAAEPTVVHMTTGAAHVPPFPGFSGYAGSKLAAANLFTALAAERPDIKVMIMHPGVIHTDMGLKANDDGLVLPPHDISLPAQFAVWLVSPEADFLRGKLVWANWDVEELKARREELSAPQALTIGLLGWP